MSSRSLGNWRTLTFSGIIAILYGLLAVIVPDTTVTTMVMYFGIILLIIGLAMLWGAVSNIRAHLPYVTDLISSVITIIIGVLLTFYTAKSLTIFVIIIGAWAVIMAILQLYLATRPEFIPSEKNTFLINGLISLVFGIILFFNPFETAQFLVVISGILAFIIGVVLIYMSVKLKNIEKTIVEELPEED